MTITTNKYFAIVGAIIFFFSVGALFATNDSVQSFFVNEAAALGTSGCGDCSDDTPEVNEDGGTTTYLTPPTCDIRANVSAVAAGEEFTISWDGSPSDATFKVNDSLVNVPDSAMYTFDGAYNYARFVLYGVNEDGECSDEVKVTKEVTEHPGCTDEAAENYNPDATEDDGSCTYQPPLTCTDFGFDYTIAKWEVEGSKFTLDKSPIAPYTVNVSGTENAINWTASPAVAGVLTKASTDYKVTDGGTAGSVSKSQIGTGKHAISNISFCGKKVVEEKECKLELHKSVDKSSANVGDILTYTIAIKSVGTATCTGGGVRIKDVIDSHLMFLSSTEQGEISQGYNGTPLYDATSRTLTWNGHDLVPGESGTITWKAKITKPSQCGPFTVYNQAKTTAKELDNFKTWVWSNTVKTDVVNDCPQPPQCVSFTATPDTLAYGGGTVTLAWDTEHADTVTINNGIGAVTEDGSRAVTVTNTINYVMTVSAAGYDDVYCPAKVTVLPPDEKDPITCEDNVTLTATPNSFPFGGGSTVLEWTTTNIKSVTIEGDVVPTDGSKSIAVTDDATFILKAIGDTDTAGNEVSCPISVTVADPEPDPISCEGNVTFTASPESLGVGGGTTTLSWSTTEIETVLLDGVAVALSGSKSVSVTGDTSFTLMVTGDNTTTGNEVSCPVSVSVADPEPEPITCEGNVAFSASPTSFAAGGGTVTLTWSTSKIESVVINGTTQALDGSTDIAVTDDTTFTLVATGDSTTTGNEVSCPVSVTVADPNPLTCQDVSFTASDTSVDRGDDVTLTWSWGSNVTGASIDNGIGVVSNNANRTVEVNSDITYRITIENADSQVSCPVFIDVDSGGGGGGGSSSPRCDLDISDSKIRLGEEITLTWDTTRATEVTIEDDEGNIIMTTDDKLSDDKDEFFDGEITLKPTRDTKYTLTAERGSRDRECEVEVEIDGGITVLETRNQEPRVAGIALTQVPYTGFEAGPMLTLLFYGLLTIWALFVAYVVVIRRDSIGGVSLAGAHENTPYKEHSVDEVSARMSKAEAYVATATRTPVVPAHLSTETTEAPVVGYAATLSQTDTEEAEDFTALENFAHEHKALISSDAMRYFIGRFGTGETALEELAAVIAGGKTSFPSEDGWLVLNLSRIEELLNTVTASQVPANLPTATTNEVVSSVAARGIGSLAEAVVTGDVIAAYQMIANRPMIALADAAADLDAVYRLRKGGTAVVSDMLMNATTDYTDTQLTAAIAALTSALDGTYTSEEEAVKMAIMKAVKALS